jgi:hypothetical protein
VLDRSLGGWIATGDAENQDHRAGSRLAWFDAHSPTERMNVTWFLSGCNGLGFSEDGLSVELLTTERCPSMAEFTASRSCIPRTYSETACMSL